MKPSTSVAMDLLIGQIRAAVPFEAAEARACTGRCEGCSLKLLDYLASELQGWEARLARGEQPGLGDLSRLARTARKVYAVLARNGLVPPEPSGGE